MKAKVPLDLKSLQGLLLDHVEKIGLAIVLSFCAYLVYSALTGVERYAKTPEQLSRTADNGARQIEGGEGPADSRRAAVRLPGKPQPGSHPRNSYEIATPINPPLFERSRSAASPCSVRPRAFAGPRPWARFRCNR